MGQIRQRRKMRKRIAPSEAMEFRSMCHLLQVPAVPSCTGVQHHWENDLCLLPALTGKAAVRWHFLAVAPCSILFYSSLLTCCLRVFSNHRLQCKSPVSDIQHVLDTELMPRSQELMGSERSQGPGKSHSTIRLLPPKPAALLCPHP